MKVCARESERTVYEQYTVKKAYPHTEPSSFTEFLCIAAGVAVP